MTKYLWKMGPTGEPIALIGKACVTNGGGWRFLSNVSGHQATRTARATAEAAIPRWAKKFKPQQLMTAAEYQSLVE